MLPDAKNLNDFLNQMGSMGQAGDAETSGGGRVVLVIDSINITSWGSTI